ncbi:MAG: 16S rRNA (uracil(1498)-N(3))-methyltransferase [Brevundimonas subvibrioides]|uniref:Ribosomal RNA small subunit methyltransferase E n=1 Tax=Brevundimonas subvibrioides TaxID=74313 RepID=A0A258HDZ4_9CAUL|nr:16S rRNA (uracil(1498)-N(3))-methyltransferase [Brevundimonas subvibrioides]OYX55211.1 MAG: 16S rRNA (uracil(1498)-N(3))-methyltransferase [Brevundimonas subvibrioides]
MIRLHVTPDLSAGAAVAPTLDQSRYLTQVMRLKLGDDLLIFNGRDGEWRATIAEILKKGVVLRAGEQVRPQTLGPDLDLIVAVVKKSRVETIVEKAAELGARRVRLTVTQRTNVEHVRLDRLDAIAIEAAEQTGRLDVPTVDDPEKLAAILDGWDGARRLMFCDETGGAPVAAAVTEPGPWAILIGPEGGFSPEERERLRALPFTTAVSLGPRILRADTAAIAAMTLWQAAVGDWERAA